MTATALAAVIVGYWLGRARPYATLADLSWRRAILWPRTAWDLHFWGVVWIATHPRKAFAAWRKRNDPPVRVRSLDETPVPPRKPSQAEPEGGRREG